ncbi:unnamed protein product [Victoria cruziana]
MKLPEEIYELTSLEELDLSYCKEITGLPIWLGDSSSSEQHVLGKLKVLVLRGCCSLTTCPNFMSMPQLHILDFCRCDKMTVLHPSIGHLKNLINLNLKDCKSLEVLPQEVWQLASLQELTFKDCSQITALPSQIMDSTSSKQLQLEKIEAQHYWKHTTCPDFTSMSHLQLKNLIRLDLSSCESLKVVPQEIGQMASLKELDLFGCSQILTVPESMRHMKQLKCVRISFCKRLKYLPQFPPSLTKLDASFCDHLEFIADVSNLKGLEELHLSICKRLVDIPGIEQLNCLKILNIGGCTSLHNSLLERLQELQRLEELLLTNCENLSKRQDFTSLVLNWLNNLKKHLRVLDLSRTKIEELPALEKLQFLRVAHCDRLKFLPQIPPSLIKLTATSCTELTMIPDVSNAKGLQRLDLRGCRKLLDVPGIEQLKELWHLELGGCRSLQDSFLERHEEANFENLYGFSIRGRVLIDGRSSYPQSLSFLVPKQFRVAILYLNVEESSLKSIYSTLPDKLPLVTGIKVEISPWLHLESIAS